MIVHNVQIIVTVEEIKIEAYYKKDPDGTPIFVVNMTDGKGGASRIEFDSAVDMRQIGAILCNVASHLTDRPTDISVMHQLGKILQNTAYAVGGWDESG